MKRQKRSSFIGEHTAEYILVPEFLSILRRRWDTIVPIHFWADREGAAISRECDDGEPVGVIAMYPRRPKVFAPHDEQIEMKINGVLFEHASLLAPAIPVIAGLVRAASVWPLAETTPCSWFLVETGQPPVDMHVVVDRVSGTLVNRTSGPMIRALEPNDVLSVTESMRPMGWGEALDVIRTARPEKNFASFFLGGRYKPVYFVVRTRR